VKYLSGTRATLNSGLMESIGRYRHRVFVEKLGWQLRAQNGLEYDQFDRDDSLYLVAQDIDGDIVGTARLLPTTRPYLLQEVFPELMGPVQAPCSDDVWELSRFAAMDFNARRTTALGQFSSEVATGLLRASLDCAAAHGVSRVITVSPLGVERLARSAGYRARRVSVPREIRGEWLCALWIDTE
jgi:acyl homoserine lactone synthase